MSVPTGDDRRAYVNAMFGRIAGRYDLMNTLMTLGLDHSWRAAAVQVAKPPIAGLGLDVGTGTGKLALELARMMPLGRVVGADFALPMLQVGRPGLLADADGDRVDLVAADALELPFPANTFDCVLSAFTVRNLAALEDGFREQARVARPGGRVVCLELASPPGPLFAIAFGLYFRRLVPVVGKLVARDADAYAYLPESVAQFARPRALAAAMDRAGLTRIRWRRLALGTVTLHVAEKAPTPV